MNLALSCVAKIILSKSFSSSCPAVAPVLPVIVVLLKKAENVSGLEKAVKFTKKGRALGLGQCGLHTYLQSKMVSFESLEAMWINAEVARIISEQSKLATKD